MMRATRHRAVSGKKVRYPAKLHERVVKALEKAQETTRTRFHFLVKGASPEDAQRMGEAVFFISQTDRGKDDPLAFSVFFNPILVSEFSDKELRIYAGHEVIHAMLSPLEVSGVNDAAVEPVTYQLQRALFGDQK